MSSVTSSTISQLYIGVECKESGTSCTHNCEINFSDGRKINKNLAGSDVCALMKVVQTNIVRTRNNHFARFENSCPPAEAVLVSLVASHTFNPELSVDDLRAKIREQFPRNDFFSQQLESDIAKGLLKDPSGYIKLLIEKRGNTQNFTPFDCYLNFLKNYFRAESS